MSRFRLLPFLAGLAVTVLAVPALPAPASKPPAAPRNLFQELLGKSPAALEAKIARAWQQLFYGHDVEERVYYPVGDDLAYIADVGNEDVRSEGMSYGLMLAVQLDHRAEFDRLWKWTKRYMYHRAGARGGYFAWQCRFDGAQLDPGSASDGEEWIALALMFASHRWGNGTGIFDYGREAQALLREMIHKPATAEVTAIFDPHQKQVVFAPSRAASQFTDPSYHLPHFYELWARWAADAEDRKFWAEAAVASRDFLAQAAHPSTGLMPEYAHFDGTPYLDFGAGRGDFRFDAWRTLANVALDHAWFPGDNRAIVQSNRVLRFLAKQGPLYPNQYALTGEPLSAESSIGLIAMAAVAGLAADGEQARPFVQLLWDAPVPAGNWRYYDGLLYFLGLLEAGGQFKVYSPPLRSP